jgi:hypothetical protein
MAINNFENVTAAPNAISQRLSISNYHRCNTCAALCHTGATYVQHCAMYANDV